MAQFGSCPSPKKSFLYPSPIPKKVDAGAATDQVLLSP